MVSPATAEGRLGGLADPLLGASVSRPSPEPVSSVLAGLCLGAELLGHVATPEEPRARQRAARSIRLL